MFWGLILKANKKYSQELEKSFHLSHAALDTSASDDQKVQVMYVQDGDAYLLCTLQKDKVEQFPLDLNFAEGSKVSFSIRGAGIVHLTGYLIPEEDFDDFGDEEEDSEVDEKPAIGEALPEDLRKLLQSKTKSEKKAEKKAAAAAKSSQKPPVEEDSDDSELEMGEDDSDDDEEMNGADSDDEAAESDESEEEEVEEPKPKQQKLEKSVAKHNGVEKNGTAETKKKPEQKQDKNDKPKQLQGGVTISDLKPGTGAEAKAGKKVKVYYVGRLQSNNKEFDSAKTGPGFAFSLGRGEVIRGWDVGVVGMKVGGKRRITCPPAMAYGAKGSPPVIPSNATLVFEVELKHVK